MTTKKSSQEPDQQTKAPDRGIEDRVAETGVAESESSRIGEAMPTTSAGTDAPRANGASDGKAAEGEETQETAPDSSEEAMSSQDKAVKIPITSKRESADSEAEAESDNDSDPTESVPQLTVKEALGELKARFDEVSTELKDVEEKRKQYLRNLASNRDQIRRLEKSIEESRRYGAERLGRDILTTYDNLLLAICAGQDKELGDVDAWLKGIETTIRDLKSTLKRHNITEIIPRIGDQFDPGIHEAMYNVPFENFVEGQIVQVEQTGFLLHDRLLRPAKVGVAAGLIEEPEPDPE